MHEPVPVPAWALAVTAAVAGVAVGSYLMVPVAGRLLPIGDWDLAVEAARSRR